jgi:hypothetical protein
MTVQALESTAPAELPVRAAHTTSDRVSIVARTTSTSRGLLGGEHSQARVALVLEGLSQPVWVRLERDHGVTSVADVATGVFGAGNSLQAAVQDFRSALEEHLAVLSAQPELAPDLRYQLEVLRTYFAT